MKKKLEHLKLLISSQEAQEEKGNLTETGIAYLNGLRSAAKIFETSNSQTRKHG